MLWSWRTNGASHLTMANLIWRIRTKRLPRAILLACAGVLIIIAVVIGARLFTYNSVKESQTTLITAHLKSFDVSAFRGGRMLEMRTAEHCAHFVCLGVTPFRFDAFMKMVDTGLPVEFKVRNEDVATIDSCGRVEMVSLSAGDKVVMSLEEWNAETQDTGTTVTLTMTVILLLISAALIWIGLISPTESDTSVERWERHSIS